MRNYRVMRSVLALHMIGLLTWVILLASCGGGSGPGTSPISSATAEVTQAPIATQSPLVTAAPAPMPTAQVVWFSAKNETDPLKGGPSPLARFVALISNPTNQALVGLTTAWTMLDQSGAIVGHSSSKRCPIQANDKLIYVGGAGGAILSGLPNRVEVRITDTGQTTANYTNRISVEGVSLAPPRESGSSFRDVSFTLVNAGGYDIRSTAVQADILIKDSSGNVVGADFAGAGLIGESSGNVPSSLSPGAKVALTDGVPSDLWTGEGVTAEVFACYDPTEN
jgi:hypothetical protein